MPTWDKPAYGAKPTNLAADRITVRRSPGSGVRSCVSALNLETPGLLTAAQSMNQVDQRESSIRRFRVAYWGALTAPQ
jgi:hypothetical protein